MILSILYLIPTIITIFVILIGIISILIILNIKKNYNCKKMLSDTYDIFLNIIEERKLKDYSTLKVSDTKAYDFYFESRTHIYYIKVVPNFKNHEICVNNKTKWQIISSVNETKAKYVEQISKLMNLDVSYPSKKIVKKLYVIYPNARSLVKYINECELAFIYPNTDVYGANIITYEEIKERPEKIEAK